MMEVKEGEKMMKETEETAKLLRQKSRRKKDCRGYIMCIWMSYNAYSNLTRYIFINHSK